MTFTVKTPFNHYVEAMKFNVTRSGALRFYSAMRGGKLVGVFPRGQWSAVFLPPQVKPKEVAK